MPEFKVDNAKIAEAISLLTSVYNNPDEKIYAKAKALVESSAQLRSFVIPMRADRVKEEALSDFWQSDTEWLDNWLGGGPRRGEIIIVGGSPFSGKTHFMTWLAARYANRQTKRKVAHLFREDNPADVRKYYQAAGGTELLKRVWEVNVKDYSFTAQTAEQAIQAMEKEGNKPDIVILDHLDIMQSVFRARADWEDASVVINESKVMSVRQDVVTIAGSQLNERTRESKGAGRFYRAKVAKMAAPDFILFIDDVQGNEYHMSRIKWKGRDCSPESNQKVLLVDWNKMVVEDVT
jgi:replicative DNA helicase